MTANAIMPNLHRSVPARLQGRGRNGTELCQARWKLNCLWDWDATHGNQSDEKYLGQNVLAASPTARIRHGA